MKFPFPEYKSRIEARISELLTKEEKDLQMAGFWSKDAIRRLKSFVLRGKTLRGSLVIFSHQLFGGTLKTEVIDTAAALELIHSALLIQDDIMDEDLMRRGIKTIHLQYANLGKRKKIKNSSHFGESAAGCLADIAFFVAFGLLGRLALNLKAKKELWNLFTKELTATAIGQIEDVASVGKREVNLTLYRAKTARYTFVLPLLAGALLAGKKKGQLKNFEKLGEVLGIIFQLKDDELDGKRKGREGEILRLARKARRLILSLATPKQKGAFSALLVYNLERKF